MRISPRSLLVAGVFCLVTLAGAPVRAAYNAGENHRTMSFGGLERTYGVHVPPGYDGSTAVPLVVNLHGLASFGAQQEGISKMPAVADAHGFLLAYPDGYRNAWDANVCCAASEIDDVGFIRAMVAAIAAEASIDARRVYATGLSNGGAMSQYLACQAADLFAASAPMAFPLTFVPASECQPARSIPVLTVMGLTDVLVRYNGPGFGTAPDTFQYWRDINGCTGDPVRVDSGQSRCETVTTCANGVQVGLCSVTAQAFPGSSISGHILYLQDDFNLAEVAWDFLSQFTLPDDVGTPPEAALVGPDRIKLGSMVPHGHARLAPLQWTVRLGQGTWGATDSGGAALSGSWRRARHGRTGTLELTGAAATQLQGLVAERVATLTGTRGLQFTLEAASPLRVAFDRTGAATSLRARFRVLRGGVPEAAIGRCQLKLRRQR